MSGTLVTCSFTLPEDNCGRRTRFGDIREDLRDLSSQVLAFDIRHHEDMKQMMEALRILVAGRVGTDISDLAVGTTTVTWDQAGSISFEPARSPPPRPPPKHLEDPRPKDTESVGGEERATSPPKTAEPVDARDMAPPPSKPLPLEEQLANQDVGTSPPQTLSKEGADGPMDVVAPNGPEDRPQGNEGAGAGPQAEEPVKGPTEPTEEARTDTAEGGPTAGEGVQATEQPKQTEAPPAPPAADLGMVMDLDGPLQPGGRRCARRG